MAATQERLDEDAARLAELGYTSEFRREISLRANFAPGFTYLAGGLLYMLAARSWEKSTAAAGDAVKGGA